MKINNRKQQLDNLIGQKVAQSFGYSDEQLIAEFDRVAAEPEDPENPEPEAPADTFDKILLRLDEKEKEKRKVIRIDRLLKVSILVAVVSTIWFGPGLTASGKRGFEYWIREPEGGGNRVVWNNTGNLGVQGKEDEAYQRIHDELGIKVLQLMYKPESMQFAQLEIYEGYATMKFVYNDKNIYLTQTQQNAETSIGVSSDQENDEKVYNRPLKQELIVNKNKLDEKLVELSTEFVYEKAGYRLEGIMDEEEFRQIVKKMAFDE